MTQLKPSINNKACSLKNRKFHNINHSTQCINHAINSTKHAKIKAQEILNFFWLSLNLCAKPKQLILAPKTLLGLAHHIGLSCPCALSPHCWVHSIIRQETTTTKTFVLKLTSTNIHKIMGITKIDLTSTHQQINQLTQLLNKS